MSVLEISDLTYSYKDGGEVLKRVCSTMKSGKMYAILGHSGCGKSTLLSLMGGLDSPTSGQILVDGESLQEIGLNRYRREYVSFVFQEYNLIDYMNAVENVALTAQHPPLPFLEELGLEGGICQRNVTKLSGGQQQRVAIARALASDAGIILADEPTGSLDQKTGNEITALLKSLAHDSDKLVVVVTHSRALAKAADEVLHLENGALQTASAIEAKGKRMRRK